MGIIYILYFGYCYWDGDSILCTKQIVDGGSGLLSNLVCRRRRLPPDWWWPLAVADEVGELSMVS